MSETWNEFESETRDVEAARRERSPSSGSFGRTLVLCGLVAAPLVWLEARDRLPSLAAAAPRAVTPRGDLAQEELTNIELFRSASPAVVGIRTSRRGAGRFAAAGQIPDGTGSGFVWDERGHVVTNWHVVRSADAAEVQLSDGRSYAARLVGYEAESDLAVLAIDARDVDWRPLPIGTSRDLQVGQRVFAIGSPYGLDQSLSTGIISALRRSIRSVSELPIHGVIQTDAAINPGNSGGPLLDSAGRLIGVNTSIKSPTGANAGIGFAVPVDLVNNVVPRILSEGLAHRAGLGVVLGEDREAAAVGVRGAVVEAIVPFSGAAAAGLQPARVRADGSLAPADVIVGIDEHPIESRQDLFTVMGAYDAGERVAVELLRDTGSAFVPVRLEVELQRLGRQVR